MSSTLGYLRQAREWAYPTLKQSAFLDKGVLTPEEFVLAGDELVYRCPTWQWEGGNNPKVYLPPQKQYLVTRNVPCQNRVASMESDLQMTMGGEGDDDEDWLVSSIIKNDKKEEDEDDFDILDDDGEVMEKKPAAESKADAAAAAKSTEDEDEYTDMADFEDENVLTDDAAVACEEDSNLVKVRTYDLSITYDKYYQTPRVWMTGRNTQDQPLTGAQMMEDVISDYANKTVTMESHPHVAGPHASIHPCQHGKVMKAIVKNLIKKTATTSGGEDEIMEGPSVVMYLFIFLKFVSSMIPTINYDFTMDVTADTSK